MYGAVYETVASKQGYVPGTGCLEFMPYLVDHAHEFSQ
jgi:hypothetical protein